MKSAAVVVALSMVGCGVPTSARTPESAKPLAVHAVSWSAAQPPATAKLVADLGSDVVVFSDGSATISSDGVVANVDRQVGAWVSAGTIPAPDGSGLWIVGVDSQGQLWRLRARRSFEPISERYGLASARVREVCGFGGRFVGFSLADASAPLAIADGSEVDRYASGALTRLTGGSGTMAGLLAGGDVWWLDARTRSGRRWELGDARDVAVDDQGITYVATSRAIYSNDPDGTLVLRYVGSRLHGLVASHDHVWFAEGDELGTIDATEVHRSRGVKLPQDATLTGSPSGDVWALSRGALTRYALGESPTTASRVRWEDAAQPVYGRVCSTCHASDGTAGVDLSTADQWRSKRDLIRQRVLVDKDMPPKDHPITDPDRESIRHWLDAPL